MKKYILSSILTLTYLNGSSQTISTIVGGGTGGGTDGYGTGLPATNATLGNFAGIACDLSGNLYIADKDRQIIRKVDRITGVINTIAGNGTAGFSGDGMPATGAKINNPGWISFDSHGNLFFTDRANHRVRKVDVSGIITTVAGIGTASFSGDGFPATAAGLNAPQGLCIDRHDNIYIADNGNKRVRKITTSGIISTIAGTGTAGYSGDGGPAISAEMQSAYGISTDTTGNVFFADWNGDRVRKVAIATGIISTIAGNGVFTYTGDGVAAVASGVDPFDVTVDDTGNIFIADYTNNRIRKVNATGIISTVAGNGTTGYSGDGGAAMSAAINRPAGVKFDVCRNLLLSDNENHRVRKVSLFSYTTPSVSVLAPSIAAIGATVTVNATVSGTAGSYSIKWFKNSSLFSTTTIPTVTYTKGAGTDTITARVVPAASYCSDSATSAPHLVAASGVGVEDAIADIGLILYPSPTAGVLHVSAAVALKQIEVTNLLGQRVLNVTSSGTLQDLDVSRLPQGVYLMRVNDVWVRRFVKE